MGEKNHGPPHPQSHVQAANWGGHQEELPPVLASTANMTVDWPLPGGTCGRGIGGLVCPGGTDR